MDSNSGRCSFLNTECCILCVQSCFRILSFNPVVRDAFREVGLLEVLTSLVAQFSDRLKAKGDFDRWSACLVALFVFLFEEAATIIADGRQLSPTERTFALLTIDMLTMLMKGNAANARKCAFPRLF